VTTPSALDQFIDLIEQRTGLAARAQFGDVLETLLDTLSQGNREGYVRQMQAARETDPVWQAVIKALTIGETYFLRDHGHFHLLKTRILPDLIERRRVQRELAIWSVGCASGEEPYSLALTLVETLPDLMDWKITLLGTDLNAQALNVARRGIYRKWSFRHTDIDFHNRYFDPATDGLQIKPFIREMVTFRHANLLAGAPHPAFDLILCRHVLLYFSPTQVGKAESILFDALTPGGWLMLGQSEALRTSRDRWTISQGIGVGIYQKPITTTSEIPRAAAPLNKTNGGVTQKRVTGELPSVASATYEIAVRAIRAEDYGQAEQLLVELLRLEPDSAPTHTLMAYLFANRRDHAQAYKYLDTAQRLDPLLADAHYLQALLLLEESRVPESLKALRAALYCQRNHPLAAYLLGTLYQQRGDRAKAVLNWQNARRAIASLMPDSLISDVSDITAGRLRALIEADLGE
jgi:chemotaxis protein methyltransferase CheR